MNGAGPHAATLLHPGDRQPGRCDELDRLLSRPAGCASDSPTPSSSSWRPTAGGSYPGSSGLTTTAEKFRGRCTDLTLLPSEYFRRQCWISFDPDEAMLAFTAESPLVGADRIIWAVDYPHPDAKFPGVT